MIKSDSLVEKLVYYSKHGLFTHHEERDLVIQAAMKIQTLQAEKNLAREGVRPDKTVVKEFDGEMTGLYSCGSCGDPILLGDRFCRRCGKRVKWDVG